MKKIYQFITVVSLLCTSAASSAAIVVHNSLSTFTAATNTPGTDTFEGMSLTGITPSPITRSAGPYSYTAAVSTTSFFAVGTIADTWLSTNTATDTITFNNFSSGVTAIGGFFFDSDISGVFKLGDIIVTATDASGSSTQTLTNSLTTTFLGFVLDGPLISLTVSAVQPATTFAWPTINDLTLAKSNASVPEPEVIALFLIGFGAMGVIARRRQYNI
jgi:hypothetical protein